MAKANCFAIILLCAALLPACSKEEPARAPAATGSASAPAAPASPAAPVTAQAEPAKAEAPPPRPVEKADRSWPLSEYKVLDSSRTLMFAYLSVDAMPIEYERIAALVSAEYARSNDEFRKRDLLAALKPGSIPRSSGPRATATTG